MVVAVVLVVVVVGAAVHSSYRQSAPLSSRGLVGYSLYLYNQAVRVERASKSRQSLIQLISCARAHARTLARSFFRSPSARVVGCLPRVGDAFRVYIIFDSKFPISFRGPFSFCLVFFPSLTFF